MKPKYPKLNRGRLRVGQIIQLIDGAHEVVRVNESGAYVRPFNRRKVEIKTVGGKEIKFTAPMNSFTISSESEVTILAPSREEYKP